jgi:uncharacterized protein YbjT (DUF2867 family)
MKKKVIITGATGMVGEGVLFECLKDPRIEKVLILNRKHYDLVHPKLEELLVPDFMNLSAIEEKLKGYDACFYCAGTTSLGMSEAQYTYVTHDVTMHVAETLVRLNPEMIFDYISGAGSDSTEHGTLMWTRVKGITENDLMKLPFKRVYNIRPGFMKPTAGQKNLKGIYKIIRAVAPLALVLFPSLGSTLQQVAQAMINTITIGYPKQILEIKDIKALAQEKI